MGIRDGFIRHTDIYNKNAEGLMRLLNRRNKKIVERYECSLSYEFEPHDKLILGEGGGVYFDMQPLRLHPLYGITYIPASVLKGTLRSVWVSERHGGKEEEAEKDEDFIHLFGGKRKDNIHFEGNLRFIDLYPKSFMIGLDVQTVHYKNYYNKGHKEFTDVQSGKTPFYFVCLKKAVFPISIACNETELWTRWHNELDNMMNCMFVQYGIGAKTALGYGCGFLVHAY